METVTIGMNFLPFLIRQNPASGGRMTIFSILGDLAGALVHSHIGPPACRDRPITP
jgi:hypothetical protein